jgi:hypothetical protein
MSCRRVDSGGRATAVVNSRYRSSSGSVRYIKHNYPDQRDKSERHKGGQGHSLLPESYYGPKPGLVSPPLLSHSLVLDAYDLRNSSGSLAIFAAIRRAPSRDSSLGQCPIYPRKRTSFGNLP